MRKRIYYTAGILCLVISAALLINTEVFPLNVANKISQVKIDNGYGEYYHVGFPMPKNSLRQGTVYLPVYSMREREHLWQIILPFSMGDAEIVEHDEYFEVTAEGEMLRIHRFIDLLEYENKRGSRAGRQIDEAAARRLAQEFMDEFLPQKKPYDVTVGHDGDWTVRFSGHLSGLPNAVFPTEITLDEYGNITRTNHYFFDYEILGAADVITVKAALAQLSREHEGRAYLKGYELIYGFENSILVPVYRFYGEFPGGGEFEETVSALRFY